MSDTTDVSERIIPPPGLEPRSLGTEMYLLMNKPTRPRCPINCGGLFGRPDSEWSDAPFGFKVVYVRLLIACSLLHTQSTVAQISSSPYKFQTYAAPSFS